MEINPKLHFFLTAAGKTRRSEAWTYSLHKILLNFSSLLSQSRELKIFIFELNNVREVIVNIAEFDVFLVQIHGRDAK